jgi:hypothetical protein
MARTYQTARKSTGGRFRFGQLAPRHQSEIEEHPEEVQPEIEENREEVQPKIMVKEYQEEVQLEVEIEEDPEEVLFEDEEEPEEKPQLYDDVLLEVEADGDMMIPPAAIDAPLPR